jgi:hypothetical protein
LSQDSEIEWGVVCPLGVSRSNGFESWQESAAVR